jgi:hypothetical protein
MPTERTLVLVAGSGRSGTSLFAGVLQRLGFLVPQPEVPADPTNPRGFAESQWVVDFHTRLLKGARVQVADARPAAWSTTARVALDAEVQAQLRTWLAGHYNESDHIIIKDPRLSWFLPLWRRCAEEVGASPRFVTMLRHPAAVVDSKQKWYGGWQGEVGRAAGWINQTLFTERATRDAPRALVQYEDLLDDWTKAVGRVGETLDLAVIREASPAAMRDVHGFVDRGLSRSRPEWGDMRIPAPLRAQADEVWRLLSRLADGEPVDDADLDAARDAYVDLYAEAEAIAQSSVAAAQKSGPPPPRLPHSARWLRRRIPARYRKKVPPRVRARVARTLARSG